MTSERIDMAFIQYASNILADTKDGLSGPKIIEYCVSYAVKFNINIPIVSSDFGKFGSVVPNKRTALYKDLSCFNGYQQFTIINELSKLPTFSNNPKIKELRENLFTKYYKYSSNTKNVEKAIPTGWERVDRSITEMSSRLAIADTEEKLQAVGMLGREIMISTAQQVYDERIHLPFDGVKPSSTDAKRMLEDYIQVELSETPEKVSKCVKSTVDLCNQLTHDRNATKRDAELCLLMVSTVASMIKIIQDSHDKEMKI